MPFEMLPMEPSFTKFHDDLLYCDDIASVPRPEESPSAVEVQQNSPTTRPESFPMELASCDFQFNPAAPSFVPSWQQAQTVAPPGATDGIDQPNSRPPPGLAFNPSTAADNSCRIVYYNATNTPCGEEHIAHDYGETHYVY